MTGTGSNNTNVVYDDNDPSMNVVGGYSSVGSGMSGREDGIANDNKLTIESSSAASSVYGGWGDGPTSQANVNELIVRGTVDWAVGGLSNNGSATFNKVRIEGGTVNSNVYGGQGGGGVAEENWVILDGATVGKYVFGGQCSYMPTCLARNTLAVQGAPSTVKALVSFFDILEFTLSASTDKSKPMLSVDDGGGYGQALFPEPIGATAPVEVTIKLDGAPTLAVGDKFILIEAASKLEINPAPEAATAEYFKVTPVGNQLIAEVIKVPPAPTPDPTPGPAPTPDPTPGPTPTPYYYSGDSSSPTMGELGLLFSGLALAGVAAPALRRRERKQRKQD